jgi:hypothetical protein
MESVRVVDVISMKAIGVRRGVSKGVEDGHFKGGPPTALGIEKLGMAGPGETLGCPWPPLAIRPCIDGSSKLWSQMCSFYG